MGELTARLDAADDDLRKREAVLQEKIAKLSQRAKMRAAYRSTSVLPDVHEGLENMQSDTTGAPSSKDEAPKPATTEAPKAPVRTIPEAEAIVICQSVARRWLCRRRLRGELKAVKRRLAICRELLMTEQEYVENLKTVEGIHMPMLRQRTDWFSPQEFRVVFSELETILGFNKMFLGKLEEVMKDFNVHTTNLSSALMVLPPLLRVRVHIFVGVVIAAGTSTSLTCFHRSPRLTHPTLTIT
jgi:RhoGEF domain